MAKANELSLDLFSPTATTAGVNSMALKYQVPLNSYLITQNDSLMNLRLTTKQVYTYTSAQTGNDVTVAADALVATIGNIYDNGTDFSESVLGYWTASSTTKVVKATAVSGKNITFAVNDTTSTSATLTVYYTPKSGSFTWIVVAPTAASTISQTLVTHSIGHVNSLDQSSVDTGVFFPKKVLMTQRFELQLWAIAPVAIDMVPNYATATPNTLAAANVPIITGTMAELTARDPDVARVAVKLLQEGD